MILAFILLLFMNRGDGNINLRGGEDRDLFSLGDIVELSTHVFKERITGSTRSDLARQSRISPEVNHEVIFVIKQRNIEELTRVLHDVSDPKSKNYGKHKTLQEVVDLTANSVSRDAVLSYLRSFGAQIVSESLSGEYVTAIGPIRLWEELFHTEFFMFHQTEERDHVHKLVRAEHYYIPVGLDSHVESVFNTVQMPLRLFGGPVISPLPIHDVIGRNNKKKTESFFYPGSITPDKLKVRKS